MIGGSDAAAAAETAFVDASLVDIPRDVDCRWDVVLTVADQNAANATGKLTRVSGTSSQKACGFGKFN